MKLSLAHFVALLFCVLLVCSGCGSGNRLPLSGTVTLDGKPLSYGLIHFEPNASDQLSASTVIEQGAYKFEGGNGLAPGKYKVSIRSTPPPQDTTDMDPDKMMEMAAKARPFKDPVLSKYNKKTELSAEITAGGPATLDFKVTSK